MKNFGKIMLIIVLTLVTAAAGVFGYFFFSGKDYYDFNGQAPTKDLTISEAKGLVTKVIDDINNINKPSSASSQGTLLIDYGNQYVDYEEDVLTDTRAVVDIKVYLQVVKGLMEDENVKQGTNYICRYNGSGNYDVNGDYGIGLSFEISGNSIEIQINNIVHSEFYERHVISLYKNLEQENAWTMEISTLVMYENEKHSASYTKVFAENSKVYRIGTTSYRANTEVQQPGGAIFNKIKDEDIKNNKSLYVTPDDPAEIKDLIESVDTVLQNVKFKEWATAIYTNYDFLDAFKEQGDHGSL